MANPSETNATPRDFKEMVAKGFPPFQGYAGSERADARLGGDLFDYSHRVHTAVVSYQHTALDSGKRYLDKTPVIALPLIGYDVPDELGEIELIDAIIRPESAWGAAAAASEIIALWYDLDDGTGAQLVASYDGLTYDMVADQANYFTAAMGFPALGSAASIIPAGARLYLVLASNGAGYTMDWTRVEVRYRWR
jgi:hypothetical protein